MTADSVSVMPGRVRVHGGNTVVIGVEAVLVKGVQAGSVLVCVLW